MTKDKALKLALEALERSMEAGLTGIKVDEAITVIRQALARPEQEPFEMKWPDYNESAMGCGIEDRNITDRYEAMQYGWDEAISRVSECLPDVLFTAPPSKQEPDYGIDRGAWSDVPDATKWVDELRGDEDLDAPPNSTTDVVESKSGLQAEQEPVAWGFQNTAITGSNRWMYLRETIPTNDQYRGVLWTPLYTAPPKQPLVGLTDEDREILEAVRRELDRGNQDGNAPGHGHEVPGIWDSDNGARAGKPCAWCLTWKKFTTLIDRESTQKDKKK